MVDIAIFIAGVIVGGFSGCLVAAIAWTAKNRGSE